MDNTERRIVIRRTSWHYRLATFFADGNVPTNLCSYFWAVVGCIFCACAAVPLAVFAAPVMGIGFGLSWLWNHRPRRKKVAEATPHEPNLLVEWVKAKKRRICPLIEVKDA